MTQYNTLDEKLSNSQLNKLKYGIKSGTEATLKLSSEAVGNDNNELNFPHKLLFTNTQVSKICKVFANGSTADIEFLKNQLSDIVQLVGFVSSLFWLSSLLANPARTEEKMKEKVNQKM